MVEKSAEEKAREAKLILQEQLKLLTENEGTRLEKVRQERSIDEAKGQARGEEIFGGDALGRIDQEASPEALALQKSREGSLLEQRSQSASDVAGRTAEIERGTSELDKLISARTDPNSEIAKLQRSKGREEINRALQGQLGQVRAAGNISGSGVNQALVGDALGGAMQARAGMERDILMGGLDAAEGLTLQREGLREQGVSKREDLRSSGRKEEAALRDRLEGLQGAIQDDTLRRQLINLDQRKQELFGKLSTEQNIVSQGVAERSGVRQQILAEVGQAESTRAQREAEELQEREINKPAPQAQSGGKVICGELYRQGLLDQDTYYGDLAYAVGLDSEVVAGYQLWAKPYVELMKVSKVATYLAYPIGKAWATEMAYRAGFLSKGSLAGKIISNLGEPICKIIGKAIRMFSTARVEA
jgi:hypothetical protein